MKVQFQQSGGFAGIIKGCEFDTAALAPEAARDLEHLIRGSGLSAPGKSLSDTGRDFQQYEITIEDGSRKAEFVFDDSTVPQSAKLLLGFLKKHARPKPLD
jgi:hypothetical protein